MACPRKTCAALLTPQGRGAVATIVVHGPAAVTVVEELLRLSRGRSLATSSVGHVVYGRWSSPQGEDVVACRLGPSHVEIHCHGGVAASSAILRDLTSAGCVSTSWQEWTQRQASSSPRADARIALAHATTERSAAILLDQADGALDVKVEQTLEHIRSGDLAAAELILRELLSRSALGMHLVEPWRVVLCGAPNVGKSSLINRLLGYERSIVFDQPGTTRDVVRASTAIDGWPVQLVDTAGLRSTSDRLEAEGIQRAKQQLEQADLILLLFDDSAPPDDLLPGGMTDSNLLLVRTKCDLSLGSGATAGQGYTSGREDVVATSAVTGEGIDRLISAIGRRLVPTPPPAGAAVPFADHQSTALRIALKAVQRNEAKEALQSLEEVLHG